MLRRYSQSYGGQGALCYMPSLHGLIPPLIKRSKILVSGSMVKLTYSNLGKIVIKFVAACGGSARKSRFLTSSEAKSSLYAAVPLSATVDALYIYFSLAI